MAIAKGPLKITGSISGLSFYTRRGSDEIIVRTKGGIPGDKLKRLPQFEGVRQQQKEWSGTNKLVAGVRLAMGGLHRLADYNISPALNSLANKMQKANTTSQKGRRPVCLSFYKNKLEGFQLNRNYSFNSVLRSMINCNTDRNLLKATVSFGYVNPATDLLNVQNLPYFRLLAAIGTVSDMEFSEQLNDYKPEVEIMHGATAITSTEWYPVAGEGIQLQLETALSENLQNRLTDNVSVLLTVGIEFGTVGFDGQPTAVKYAGSARVVMVR